jgi:hypothetical protein
MKHPQKIKLIDRVWDVKYVGNLAPKGTCAEDELIFILTGWDEHDKVLTEAELDDHLADGTAAIVE